MEMGDAKKKRGFHGTGRMPNKPFKAPAGNVKGIGPLGQFTGGLAPGIVAPVRGMNPRYMSTTILGGYATDSVKGPKRGK